MIKLFGRKVAPAVQPAHSDLEAISLTMEEVSRYCVAAARRRGFPEDSLEMIAQRVCFLEQRDLPGFFALIQEALAYPEETYPQRAAPTRLNGQEGGRCPFAAGIIFSENLGTYMALPEGKVAVFTAPSNPVLMLPKLAQHAGANGIIMKVNWYRAEGHVATTLLDGHRTAHFGPTLPLFSSTQIGLCRFREESNTMPGPLRAAHINNIKMPVAVMRQLIRYIGGEQ